VTKLLIPEKNLLRRAVQDDAAAVQHGHPPGPCRFFGRMGDVNDRHPAFVQPPDHFEHPASGRRIQHGGGLVQDDRLRPHGDHAGDGQKLLLPPGQLMNLPLFHPGQSHRLQGFVDAPEHLLSGQAQVFQSEGDIFPNGGGDVLVLRILKHHAHGFPDHPQTLRIVRGNSLHPHPPLRRDQQSVQHAGQGGLSGTVAAHQGHIFPRLDGPVHLAENPVRPRPRFRAKVKPDPLHLNQRGHRLPSPETGRS